MSPEEDRTRDAVDSEPKHYQLSYSGPLFQEWFSLCALNNSNSNNNNNCPTQISKKVAVA